MRMSSVFACLASISVAQAENKEPEERGSRSSAAGVDDRRVPSFMVKGPVRP